MSCARTSRLIPDCCVALEGPHVERQQAEADRATAVAVVDPVDHRRQFLAPLDGGRERIGLVPAGGNEIEQHEADGERLVSWGPWLKLIEQGQQKAVSRVSSKLTSSHQPPRSPTHER